MCLEGPTKSVGVVSIIDHHESKPASEISESNILKEATVLAIRTCEWMRAMTVGGAHKAKPLWYQRASQRGVS